MFNKTTTTATARRSRPGRPPGPTPRGETTRVTLYRAAIELFAERGYEETTMRDIAERAGVSAGLLYRYFPGKRAVVLALYEELSRAFVKEVATLSEGTWRVRFMATLRCSLHVLGPHRDVLGALVPILVGGRDEGLFAPATAFSRERVQQAFVEAVTGASDGPSGDDGAALGRTLYLLHLAVVLWWLLDRSPAQKATRELVALLESTLPLGALAVRLPPAAALIRSVDVLVEQAFFGAPRRAD